MEIKLIKYNLSVDSYLGESSYYRTLSQKEIDLMVNVFNRVVTLHKFMPKSFSDIDQNLVSCLKEVLNSQSENYSKTIYIQLTDGKHTSDEVAIYRAQGVWRWGLNQDYSGGNRGESYYPNSQGNLLINDLVSDLENSYLNK